MKMIDKSKKRILYPLFFIVLSGIIVFNIVRIVSSGDRDVNRVKAYKVSGGWGYQLSHNGKVFIDQPYIPVIQGKIPFPDKKSAIKTGKRVLERIEQHKLPHLTIEDLREMGLAD